MRRATAKNIKNASKTYMKASFSSIAAPFPDAKWIARKRFRTMMARQDTYRAHMYRFQARLELLERTCVGFLSRRLWKVTAIHTKQQKTIKANIKPPNTAFLPTSITFGFPVIWTPAPTSCVRKQMMSLITKTAVIHFVLMLDKCSASKLRIIRPRTMYIVAAIKGGAHRMRIS